MRIRSALYLGLLLLLAACGSAPVQRAAIAPPPPPAPAPILTPEGKCLADLSSAQVDYQALDHFGEGNCAIANPVRIAASPIPLSRPGVVSCDMARTMIRFDQDVVAPLALKYFNQAIKRIDHFGTYDCRAMRTEKTAKAGTGTSKGGKLSEHAAGRAIDFSGVELADGRVITVKDHWRSGGANAQFLHDLARHSCGLFNVVLTPNHDRLHQDHIHLDVGPNVLCGY